MRLIIQGPPARLAQPGHLRVVALGWAAGAGLFAPVQSGAGSARVRLIDLARRRSWSPRARSAQTRSRRPNIDPLDPRSPTHELSSSARQRSWSPGASTRSSGGLSTMQPSEPRFTPTGTAASNLYSTVPKRRPTWRREWAGCKASRAVRSLRASCGHCRFEPVQRREAAAHLPPAKASTR